MPAKPDFGWSVDIQRCLVQKFVAGWKPLASGSGCTFLQVVQRDQSADALDGDDEHAIGCKDRDIGTIRLQCEIRPDDELPLG